MIIQLNSDNNLILHEAYRSKLSDLLSEELQRYSESITRLEVHLSDENSDKKGLTDKRCLLEARLEGRQPIAVTELSDTYDNAVAGAIAKLKASLETIHGRMKSR